MCTTVKKVKGSEVTQACVQNLTCHISLVACVQIKCCACSTSVYESLFALLALSVVEPSVGFINCLTEFPHSTASDSFELSGYIRNVTCTFFYIFSLFRVQFALSTLLTFLSATVKHFRFKWAEKFLLEELTY